MGTERFVSLTTFRKTGEPVPTAVWVTPSPDGPLLVTTDAKSGKVKRLRTHDEVELRPCSRTGKVGDGAPVAKGRAEILTGETDVTASHRLIAKKYGMEFRGVMTVERIMRRGHADRVILKLTPDEGIVSE